MQKQALKFAKDLGVTDFKASYGCFDSLKKCHNFGTDTMMGGNTMIKSWKIKIPEMTAGYPPKDVYSNNDSVFFF